ncbi:hypothetical protein D9M68_861000 [compost metagenome]
MLQLLGSLFKRLPLLLFIFQALLLGLPGPVQLLKAADIARLNTFCRARLEKIGVSCVQIRRYLAPFLVVGEQLGEIVLHLSEQRLQLLLIRRSVGGHFGCLLGEPTRMWPGLSNCGWRALCNSKTFQSFLDCLGILFETIA